MWDNYPDIKKELLSFEEYLREKLPKRNEFLKQACRSVVLSGGKRIRPALTILCAMMGNYTRNVVFPAAASIEILHTATLIHDDIIDNAKTRRGQPTISDKHSINLAVYTGDYLLAKSLRLLVETGLKPERLDIVAHAVNSLCEGEIDQYLGKYDIASVHDYLKRVMRKTGVLFSAACLLGAKAGGLNDDNMRCLARLGMSFGAAFQIKDDLIDIESDAITEGKPVVNDLKEGIATLPVILAVRNNPELRKDVDDFFDGQGNPINIIRKVISSGGAKDALGLKKKYIEKCRGYLLNLPDGIPKGALNDMVNWL